MKVGKVVHALTLICLVTLALSLLPHVAEATGTGIIRGVVTDDDGRALVAQLRFMSPERGILRTFYTGWLGGFEAELPSGRYTVEVSRGPEYEVKRLSVQLGDGEKRHLDVTLSRLYDLASLGWFGGDTHLHSTYSDGRQDVEAVARAAVACGLSWAVLTDHNSISGHVEWLKACDMPLASSSLGQPRHFLAIPGEEVTTSLGHFNAVGIRSLVNWDPAKDRTDIARIFRDIARQSALSQINHPYAPGDMAFKNWDVDGFSAIEVWNGGAPPNLPGMGNAESIAHWFSLLDSGRRIPGIAASDCHDVTGEPYASLVFAPLDKVLAVVGAEFSDPKMAAYVRANESKLRAWAKAGLYPGNPRTYVRVARLTEFSVLKALARGNSFMTNGPLLLVDIDGKGPGDTVAISDGRNPMLNIKALSNTPLTQVKVIQGGKTIKEIELAGQLDYVTQVELNPEDGGWVVVEAFGTYPGFAITNPIYLVQDARELTVRVRITGPGNSEVWNGMVRFAGDSLTAMDALEEACIAAGISWHANAGFVDEIAGFKMEKNAGWMYKVNGVSPNVGAGDYILSDGDEVLWYWTTWGQ